MTEQAPIPSELSPRLSGSLGVSSIVFMVVAAAAPLTVIAGVVPIGFLVGNGPGFPAMFAVSAVILLFFAVGFTTMTPFVSKSGAFFAYIAAGLGRKWGLSAAYLALLCYIAVEVAVFGYIGAAIRDGVVRVGGPEIPWWIFAFAMIATVGALGFRHIGLSSRVLAVLLILEITIVLILSIVIVAKGGQDGLTLKPFSLAEMGSGSPALGLMFAIAGFIGFEATAIFRDEVKDPNRTIPKATYVAVILIGLFYTFAAWAIVVAWGAETVVKEASKDPAGFVILTAHRYLGSVGEVGINVLLITSVFAAALSFHNVIARYLHMLSAGSFLPRKLSDVHGKHLAPSNASVVTSAISAAVIAVGALVGMDPYLQIFGWFVGLSALSLLVLLASTCLAVIVFFRRNNDLRIWKTVTAPLIGFIGLAGAALVTAKNFPLLVGDVDASGSPVFGAVSLGLLAAIVVVPVAGFVQGRILKARRSPAYDRITESIG